MWPPIDILTEWILGHVKASGNFISRKSRYTEDGETRNTGTRGAQIVIAIR